MPTKMFEALTSGSIEQLRTRLSESLRARLDAWENQATGFGTSRDKTTYSHYRPFIPLSDQELSDLYHGNDIAARVVDSKPDEMFREPFRVKTGDQGADEWIANQFERLNVRAAMADGTRWGGLFGGACIIVGADDGRPAYAPLSINRVRSVNYLYVTDRRWLVPNTYYRNFGHTKMGQPETYMVAPQTGNADVATSIVHESRLILFRGAKTASFEQTLLGSWDYSILQRPHDVLRDFGASWNAIAIMITDANQAVFKTAGLADALAQNKQREYIEARLQVIDMTRSVLRAIGLDAGTKDEPGETFERQAVSFEGVANVLEKICLRMAAAIPMPVTKLMGQSPAGMSATGESDFQGWYDGIRSAQTTDAAPKLRSLARLLLQTKNSPLRKMPEKLTVEFDSLWSLDPKQEAEQNQARANAELADAQTDQIYWEMGALTKQQIARRRFSEDSEQGAQFVLGDSELDVIDTTGEDTTEDGGEE